jgi:hypothetical protein
MSACFLFQSRVFGPQSAVLTRLRLWAVDCGRWDFRRQAVIIQTDLADGDDFGMLAHFVQGGTEVGWRFHGVGRMPADGGVNDREFLGEADGPFAAVEAGADGNHFADAGGLGAGDDFGEIARVIGIIQMGVGVVEDGHGVEQLSVGQQ